METNDRVEVIIENIVAQMHLWQENERTVREFSQNIRDDIAEVLTTHEREARKEFIEKMCNSKFIIGYYEDDKFVEYPMYEAVEIALDYPPTLPEDKLRECAKCKELKCRSCHSELIDYCETCGEDMLECSECGDSVDKDDIGKKGRCSMCRETMVGW